MTMEIRFSDEEIDEVTKQAIIDNREDDARGFNECFRSVAFAHAVMEKDFVGMKNGRIIIGDHQFNVKDGFIVM